VEGHYVSLSSAKIGPDSLLYRADVGQMSGGHISGRFHGYTVLTGQQGTIIERVFASEWPEHGFGVARDSSCEEYQMTFLPLRKQFSERDKYVRRILANITAARMPPTV